MRALYAILRHLEFILKKREGDLRVLIRRVKDSDLHFGKVSWL